MAFLEYSPHRTLHHYCSETGFNGIIENGEIWLSDLQHTNDPKELQAAGIITQALEVIACDKLHRVDIREIAENYRNRMSRLISRFGLYSFSLSEATDSLQMWQEYTDRGRGYSIGFRPTAFREMPLRIIKVIYEDPENLEKVPDLVLATLESLAGKKVLIEDDLATITLFLSIATSTKDSSWKQESEVRLIFASLARPSDFDGEKMIPVSVNPDGSPIFPQDPLMRNRGSTIIPYFSKPFGRFRHGEWDRSGSIERIVIGPNNPLSASDVTALLTSKGYKNFDVVKSRCAFRI